MFMFWSKRTVLTRRLLKAKVRREYETECETQGDTTSKKIHSPNVTDYNNIGTVELKKGLGNCATRQLETTSGTSITTTTTTKIGGGGGGGGGGGKGTTTTTNRLHQVCCGGGDEQEEEEEEEENFTAEEIIEEEEEINKNNNPKQNDEFNERLTRCKELLKSLKENQLEMLLTSVESFGADLGDCVVVIKRPFNNRLDNLDQQDQIRKHRHLQRNARHHHHPLRHYRHSHHFNRQRSRCRHCELRHNSGNSHDDDDDNPTTSDDTRLNIQNILPSSSSSSSSHLLSCQIWRWPDLHHPSELKRLPVCHSVKDSSVICCNPYHWSRLCKPESPPPPYCLIPSDRDTTKQKREDAIQSCPTDVRGNASEPCRLPDSLTTDGEERNNSEKREWCTLAYWELGGRVGRLYPVEGSTISVFDSLHDGDGLCLASLAENHGSSTAVRRTRSKIGLGLLLSLESDGIWAYNRSDAPIFVNSPTLDDPESRTLLVYRVPPGFCLNIFDRSKRPSSRVTSYSEQQNSTGPVDVNSVRISFAKGWGPKYSRQEVTSCPCWLEVLLAPCR